MNKRDAERARKRMKLIVGRLQEYVRTYSDQAHFEEYSDTIFIDDMLYGIGLALEPLEHQCANGFDKFKVVLRTRLQEQTAAAPRLLVHADDCACMTRGFACSCGAAIRAQQDAQNAFSCQHDRFKPGFTLQWLGSTPNLHANTHRFNCRVCQGIFDLAIGEAQLTVHNPGAEHP